MEAPIPGRLIFLTGSRAGSAYDLGEDEVTLGRKADRTIAFASTEVLVSARHATLLYRDGEYVLRDDDSRNGTFVNAEPISGERVLEDGDLVQFGPGGPGARFVCGVAAETMQTLDPREFEKASEILELTRKRATQDADLYSTLTHRFTNTREMVAVAYRKSKVTTRALIAVAVMSLISIVAIVVWQEQSKASLELALAELSTTLATEQASRGALEQDIVTIRTRYDSLQDVVAEEQRKLAADPRIDAAQLRELSRGVALLVYSYGFARSGTTELLRYVTDANGDVVFSENAGQRVPSITFGGSGPAVRAEGTATGFLIDSTGYIVTNRHVAEPWARDEGMKVMQERGLNVSGRFIDLRAFFPPGDQAYPLVVESMSDDADVALLRVMGSSVPLPVLTLAPADNPIRPGDQFVLIGYPTGIHNLLFRAERGERGTIYQAAGDDSRRLAEELGRRKLIQPLITNGQISDATRAEVIHNASTTVGGSGGPLINLRQQVIAVHYASVLSPAAGDPFQTQRGVPVRFAWDLLPPALRRNVSVDP